MKHFLFAFFPSVILLVSLNGFAGVDKSSVDAQRQAVQAAGGTALEQLFGKNPSARKEIKNATGYAVFPESSSGEEPAHGSYLGGFLHNNRDNKDLYMKMTATAGSSGYNLVLVFHTAEAFNNFKDVGWDFTGQLDSNAGSPLTGVGVSGAQSVMPGTYVYQFNKTGVLDSPELQGIKFMMDEKLN